MFQASSQFMMHGQKSIKLPHTIVSIILLLLAA